MKTLLFPILSIIASFLLYFLFISPQLEQVKELTAKEEEFTQSLADVQEIDSTIESLTSTYANIEREDLEKLERFLPREFDQVRVVSDLFAVISRENVEVESVFVEEPIQARGNNNNSGPKLLEHPVTVDFFASYQDFKNILKDIEKSIQIAQIESVLFFPPEGESEDSLGLGLYSYTVMFTFYSFNNSPE